MKKFKVFIKSVHLFLFVIISSFCFIECKNDTIEQKDQENKENSQSDNFILLYSTLGYESNGTKKAFVRSKEYVNPQEVGYA